MAALEKHNSRITWIDFFKGFGALLVIFGHSNLPEYLAWWIWSFHMPMFFYISGYLFSNHKAIDLKSFLKRRVETLLVPYFFFSAILLILLPILNSTSKIPIEVRSFDEVIHTLIYGWKGLALWFIPVLFFTEVLFAVLIKYLGKTSFISIIAICLLCLLGYFFSVKNIHFPYKIEVVPTALVFYALGYYSKENMERILVRIIQSNKIVLLLIIALVINIAFCYLNEGKLDMCFNNMNNFFFTYISAIAGILFSIFISYFLTIRLKEGSSIKVFVTYLGRNTMIILGIHQIIKIGLSSASSLFDQTVYILLIKHAIFWLLLHMVIVMINKHFYFFLGKRRSV